MHWTSGEEEKSVLKSLLLPLTMVFLVITVLISGVLYITHQKLLLEYSINTVHDLQSDLDKAISDKVEILLSLEKAISTNPAMNRALQAGDKDELHRLYAQYYRQLNVHLNVTHFYFHRADLVNLLRLHQPPRSGDKIDRLTAISALESLKPSWGMELGILGTYTLRVVSPVFSQGALIGFTELGVEIEDLANSILDKSIVPLEWAITIKKKRLNKQLWQEGMKVLGRKDSWDDYPDLVWVSSSLNQVPSQWHAFSLKDTRGSRIVTLSEAGGQKWHFSSIPLTDMKGTYIGDLLAFIDITEQESQHSKDYRKFLFPMIALMLFLLLYLYYALRRVDERIELHQNQLHNLAHTDVLTGLPNRHLLNDRLEHAMAIAKRRGTKLAVVFLDLDNFKHINDSYGHSVGDQLLRAVAERLGCLIRQEDTLVRQGGDEFVLMVENFGDGYNLSLIANNILKAFDQAFHLAEVDVSTSTSIGISIFPDDGDTSEVILRNADSAMYKAKEKGRNNFEYYSKSLTSSVLERITIENKLRKALKTDTELYLCYQPQYDMATGRLIGLEALARWKTQDQNQISPGVFIPVAEQSGLIYQLGEWALLTACRQAKSWLDKGIEFARMSVNVSGVQLQRNNLVGYVKEVLEQTRLPAKYLELEVTESALMQNMELSIEHLEQIRALGVSISVDDFGTGYSSLLYLKKLPIQKLKIDRSFVDGIPDDGHDYSIVTAIVSMARGLGLEVIAEGVETKRQISALLALSCRNAQGYYFSKPETADYLEQEVLKQTAKGKSLIRP